MRNRKDIIEVGSDFIRIEGGYNRRYFVEDEEFGFVYFLFLKDKLMYVGQSVHPMNRIRTHVKRGLIDFDSYCVVPSFDLGFESMNDAEASYILEFKPPHNIRIPKNDAYLTPEEIRLKFGLKDVISATNLGHKLLQEIEDKGMMPDGSIYFNPQEVERKIESILEKHYKKINHEV